MKEIDIKIKKLKLLITILPRGKRSLFVDIMERHHSNLSMCFLGKGTASKDILSFLGVDEKEKDIILSIMREDYVKDCMLEIEDKLKSLNTEHGISFVVPLESIIGNLNYIFLANLERKNSNGK